MFFLTRSHLLRQLPDLNEIIRRLTVNRDRYSFKRNIFLATAIIFLFNIKGVREDSSIFRLKIGKRKEVSRLRRRQSEGFRTLTERRPGIRETADEHE